MLWRSGDQVLVQRDDSFLLFDAGGTVVARFEPRSFSDEDDLWSTVHQVIDGQLVERTTIDHGGEERVSEQKVVVRDLRGADDVKTRSFVDASLAADAAALRRASEEQERVSVARVWAIPGALGDLGLGPDAARAQRALGDRIRRWNDERAAELLRTLVLLARSRPHAAVIAAYVRGCLCACFEHDVPALPAEEKAAPDPALAGILAAHARRLDQDAEGQEWADAPRNAAALSKAAEAVRFAAKLLQG